MNKEELPLWGMVMLGLVFASMIYEAGLIGVIGSFVLYYSTKKCWKLSQEINKNKIVAFFIGYLFGLVGLLFYWIYYKICKTTHKKQNEQTQNL